MGGEAGCEAGAESLLEPEHFEHARLPSEVLLYEISVEPSFKMGSLNSSQTKHFRCQDFFLINFNVTKLIWIVLLEQLFYRDIRFIF